MDSITINSTEAVLNIVQSIVIFLGFLWAYYRFRAEGMYKPRVEFDVHANFLGPQLDFYPTEIIISIHNAGLRKRRFDSIILLVRGIKYDATIKEWTCNEPRLYLPDKILDHTDVIYKKKEKTCIFVEPGIKQKLIYLTRIHRDYRFVSIHVKFWYSKKKNRMHSAERMFELPVKNNV